MFQSKRRKLLAEAQAIAARIHSGELRILTPEEGTAALRRSTPEQQETFARLAARAEAHLKR